MQSASFACCCVNMTGECLDRQTSHTLHSDTELLVKLHTRWRARFTDATPGPGAAHNFSLSLLSKWLGPLVVQMKPTVRGQLGSSDSQRKPHSAKFTQ